MANGYIDRCILLGNELLTTATILSVQQSQCSIIVMQTEANQC